MTPEVQPRLIDTLVNELLKDERVLTAGERTLLADIVTNTHKQAKGSPEREVVVHRVTTAVAYAVERRIVGIFRQILVDGLRAWPWAGTPSQTNEDDSPSGDPGGDPPPGGPSGGEPSTIPPAGGDPSTIPPAGGDPWTIEPAGGDPPSYPPAGGDIPSFGRL
jgi:hypothetical protein